MFFEVVESFVAAKSGDALSGDDVIADGPAWTVVCDGETAKAEAADGDGVSGRDVALVVADAVSEATAGLSPRELVDEVTRRYVERFGPTTNDSIALRPACSFVAIDKRHSRVVRVGDCQWATAGAQHPGDKLIDRIHGAARSAYLQMLVLKGVPQETLLREDPGRELLIESLRSQWVLRNRVGSPLGYGAIDGSDIPDDMIEAWPIDEETREIVLLTDGYPVIRMSLAECELELAAELADDPLRIGDYPSTKGVRPGQRSYDDRAYVRLQRT